MSGFRFPCHLCRTHIPRWEFLSSPAPPQHVLCDNCLQRCGAAFLTTCPGCHRPLNRQVSAYQAGCHSPHPLIGSPARLEIAELLAGLNSWPALQPSFQPGELETTCLHLLLSSKTRFRQELSRLFRTHGVSPACHWPVWRAVDLLVRRMEALVGSG